MSNGNRAAIDRRARRGRRVRAGTEPANARTAPRLRAVLAAGALLLFAGFAWSFFAVSGGTGTNVAGAICLLVAGSAAVDLTLLLIRARRGDYREN
ncbi:MAG: DUF6343 family protein [Sporichthyaceae bacterium]